MWVIYYDFLFEGILVCNVICVYASFRLELGHSFLKLPLHAFDDYFSTQSFRSNLDMQFILVHLIASVLMQVYCFSTADRRTVRQCDRWEQDFDRNVWEAVSWSSWSRLKTLRNSNKW